MMLHYTCNVETNEDLLHMQSICKSATFLSTTSHTKEKGRMSQVVWPVSTPDQTPKGSNQKEKKWCYGGIRW